MSTSHKFRRGGEFNAHTSTCPRVLRPSLSLVAPPCPRRHAAAKPQRSGGPGSRWCRRVMSRHSLGGPKEGGIGGLLHSRCPLYAFGLADAQHTRVAPMCANRAMRRTSQNTATNRIAHVWTLRDRPHTPIRHDLIRRGRRVVKHAGHQMLSSALVSRPGPSSWLTCRTIMHTCTCFAAAPAAMVHTFAPLREASMEPKRHEMTVDQKPAPNFLRAAEFVADRTCLPSTTRRDNKHLRKERMSTLTRDKRNRNPKGATPNPLCRCTPHTRRPRWPPGGRNFRAGAPSPP